LNASTKAAIAAIFVSVAGAASAQSSVTLYGDIDQYLSYQKAGKVKEIALEDGGVLSSRWGLKGSEDLGNGYSAKFQVEAQFSSDNGVNASAAGTFNRQSYLGLGTPWGEFRAGRQNGPIQSRGGYYDYTGRTLGSMLNSLPVPSRYDNDFSFISKRYFGLMVEAHVALPEAVNNTFAGGSGTGDTNRALVMQLGLDYLDKNFAFGYDGAYGRPGARPAVVAAGTQYQDKAGQYHAAYADWFYGRGTVYLAAVRTNLVENPGTAGSTLTSGTFLAGSGGNGTAGNNYVNGVSPTAGNPNGLNRFINAFQVSGDFAIVPNWRVGAMLGKAKDTEDTHGGMTMGSIGSYWDLSKRTTVYAIAQSIHNEVDAGYRENGSGGQKSLPSGTDVNGHKINGIGLGALVRF
jgi:predicted porin